MIGMSIKEVARNFVDRKHVQQKVKRAKLRVLSRQGAFVRRAARSSIRPAKMKKFSEMSEAEAESFHRRNYAALVAGRPKPKRPKASSRPGEPPRSQVGTLRKFLFFAYDAGSESVVVGPARVRSDDHTAPSTLEFGGSTTIRGRRRTIAPRPYMGPALAKEQPKFAALWRNSIP
tara:strand:- start:44 stop:568 length:525 start_codon:yes stop_codon:yes gene_type:complete